VVPVPKVEPPVGIKTTERGTLGLRPGAGGAELLAGQAGGGVVGGAVGSQVGDTPEERQRNALLGLGAGVVAGTAAGGRLARRAGGRATPAFTRERGALGGGGWVDPRMAEELANRAPPSGRLPPRLPVAGKPVSGTLAAARELYRKTLDQGTALRRFGRDIGKSEELSDRVLVQKGAGGLAREIVGERVGTILPEGMPTIRDAVKAATATKGEVMALVHAERALELERNGMGWKVDFTPEEARRTVARYENVPEVQNAANLLRQNYRGQLEMRHKAGVLTDEDMANIIAKGEFYVPLVRLMAEEPQALVVGTGLLNKTAGIRRMEVGEARRTIVDPWEQAVVDAQQTAFIVMRQRVTQAVATIVEASPDAAAPFVKNLGPNPKHLSPAAVKSGRVVDAVVNGKRTWLEIENEGMREALEGMTPRVQNLAVKLMSPFKKVKQTAIVMDPEFMASNAQRDFFFSALAYSIPVKQWVAGGVGGVLVGAGLDSENRSRGAARGLALGSGGLLMAKHGARVIGGLRSIVKNDAVFQMAMREGLSGGGFYINDLADAKTVIARLEKDGVSARDIFKPREWWHGLKLVNEAIELGPRVARVKSALAEGATPLRATALGRDASTDFSVTGSDAAVQAAGQTKAFWNAKLQGTDKMIRILRTKKAWAMGVAMMTAPTIALWDINKDDPHYQDLPLYNRMLGWNVPIGKHPDGRTRFQWVPKPFEVGYLFASLPELLLNFWYLRDPEASMAALKEMGGGMMQGISPVPDMLAPLGEAMIGKGGFDTFRQREIVDRSLQQLPTAERSNVRTGALASGVAKAINVLPGDGLDVAPAKVQHVIADWTGTLGRRASQNVIDPLARLAGLDRRPEKPVQSLDQRTRFLSADPGMQAESVRQVYRKHDRGRERYAEVQRREEEEQAGDPDAPTPATDAYALSHRKELRWYFDLGDQVQYLNSIYAKRREIEQDRVLSGKEKQRQLGILGREAQRVARIQSEARVEDPFARP